jgi:Carboxypeptidase regulatory-like domain
MNWKRFFVAMFALLAAMSIGSTRLVAQTTIANGSIQGIVSDASGAAVANAKITIISADNGEKLEMKTNSSGSYASGPLIPGNYYVRVEVPNFKTVQTSVVVQVGVTSAGNVQLQVGSASTVVEVSGSAVQVNTEQSEIQGVVTQEQIENLPINGRNFLDLAQLEPGVQIQDGENFDPTKAGFSSISFGGRFGRTARIEVDGLDVSDETVGTTTTGIPASAISEFQIAQSSLDLSNELTSSGAVNVATRSGTNGFHGGAYGAFRDSSVAAALPGAVPAPFQRDQFGGDFGGPVIKDKLFFFMDAERTQQQLFAPAPLTATPAGPCTTQGDTTTPECLGDFAGGYSSPFKETDLLGRVDYNLGHNARLFYRYDYFGNLAFSTFGAPTLQPFKDKNYTRTNVVGADFNTGQTTHSIRFEYLKFQNELADAVQGSNLAFANFPVSLNIGLLSTGPNLLAPQSTPQSDHQLKYDGSRAFGSHLIRWGVAYNHLQGGGFAKFFSITPSVFDSESQADIDFANTQTFVCPGGQTGAKCPFNYPVDAALIGNGQGFSTTSKSFGFPAGALGPDNRIGIYVGDSWKIKPNLTLTYGVRYVRDTGRTDSDLNTIQVLNSFLPGQGNPVQQANNNLAPQVGIAWDPTSSGKTVIRAGIGQYYENVIWNNVLFDRPGREPNGAFLSFPTACAGGNAFPVPFANGANQPVTTFAPTGACGDASSNLVPIGDGSPGTAAALLAGFQTSYQVAAAAAGTAAPNPSFIPNLIANGSPIPFGTFAPNYKTPRSIQMNVGIEHEISPGFKISADYVRNVGLHYLLSINVNHTGDAALLNTPAAAAAIATTLANCGVGTIGEAITLCPGNPSGGTGPYTPRPATIFDFAGNGLDSPDDLFGGGACPVNAGFQCAFGGINPNIGAVPLLEPIGRSVYNAFDIKLVGNKKNPLPGIKYANFQVAYTLSRFTNTGGANPTIPGNSDQDFVIAALDNNNPLGFSGPSTLDRTNQLNFGGYLDLPAAFRLGFVSHFWSPLPTSIQVPTQAGGVTASTGEIYLSDFTGDGTVGDLLPGTKVGQFGRGTGVAGLTSLINNYNNTTVNSLTPAGQSLVNAGLFTTAQLLALGAHPLPINPPPAGQIGMSGLKAFDLSLAWDGKVKEKLTITPSITFYNLVNFANFDLPTATLTGSLTGGSDSINGTTAATRNDRVGAGTGVFGLGAPRVLEFGLKFNF